MRKKWNVTLLTDPITVGPELLALVLGVGGSAADLADKLQLTHDLKIEVTSSGQVVALVLEKVK